MQVRRLSNICQDSNLNKKIQNIVKIQITCFWIRFREESSLLILMHSKIQ